MVHSFSLCWLLNSTRSGSRAIEPSSFIISQMTPAGCSPASRARSTLASVCPARRRTPPSFARSGKMWPGCTRSIGADRVRQHADRPRTVGRADAGRDSLRGIHRDREVCPVRLAVFPSHAFQAEHIGALLRDRRADETAPVRRHEIDRRGRHLFRSHHEVALVLPIRVVRHDYHTPRADVSDGVLNGVELGGCGHVRSLRTVRGKSKGESVPTGTQHAGVVGLRGTSNFKRSRSTFGVWRLG